MLAHEDVMAAQRKWTLISVRLAPAEAEAFRDYRKRLGRLPFTGRKWSQNLTIRRLVREALRAAGYQVPDPEDADEDEDGPL